MLPAIAPAPTPRVSGWERHKPFRLRIVGICCANAATRSVISLIAIMPTSGPRRAALSWSRSRRRRPDRSHSRHPVPHVTNSAVRPKQAARHAQYTEVSALQARDWSQSRIARTLGLERKTVRVWLRAGQPPSWSQPAKGSLLDVHVDCLRGAGAKAAVTPHSSGGKSDDPAFPVSPASRAIGFTACA